MRPVFITVFPQNEKIFWKLIYSSSKISEDVSLGSCSRNLVHTAMRKITTEQKEPRNSTTLEKKNKTKKRAHLQEHSFKRKANLKS